jgi:serine protease Do
MSEIELIALVERYVNGEMTADERRSFEMLRRENAQVDRTVKDHLQFTDRLKQYGERLQFENLLNSIHDEIDVQALKEEFAPHPSVIVQLWRNHHSKISVAASIAIFAVLATLFFTGYLKTQANDTKVINIMKEVQKVKNDNNAIKKDNNEIRNSIKRNPSAPSNYHGTGTGFAISSDGYIVTNFHVVNGADSVYIQNMDGSNAYHAKIIATDPAYDIAVLKITDSAFKSFGTLPYGFKRSKSDLGEDLWTFGYSKDDGAYSKGYLSSGNGIKGDSVRYQVVMDVTFGNSGGPLLDQQGNVIGVISNKESHNDGSAFAIKSRYLFKALQNIPADSLTSKLNLSNKNTMANLNRTQQIKKMQNYVFMVKVYNN